MAFEEFESQIGGAVVKLANSASDNQLLSMLANVVGALALRGRVLPSDVFRLATKAAENTDFHWPEDAVSDRSKQSLEFALLVADQEIEMEDPDGPR